VAPSYSHASLTSWSLCPVAPSYSHARLTRWSLCPVAHSYSHASLTSLSLCRVAPSYSYASLTSLARQCQSSALSSAIPLGLSCHGPATPNPQFHCLQAHLPQVVVEVVELVELFRVQVHLLHPDYFLLHVLHALLPHHAEEAALKPHHAIEPVEGTAIQRFHRMMNH
jgi:hypothetical protein